MKLDCSYLSYAVGLGAGVGLLLGGLLFGHGGLDLGKAAFTGVVVGTLHWAVMRALRARRASA